MPRNPYKTPCQAQGCRNWAMRGQTLCRVHRNRDLGPSGGAPPGNLNALRTGEHAFPLSYSDLQALAHDLTCQPHQLPDLLDAAIQSIHSRTGDSFQTLRALLPLLKELLPLVAEGLYEAELEALLQGLSPRDQDNLQAVLWRSSRGYDAETRLCFFRAIARRVESAMPQIKKNTGKTTNGTGRQSSFPQNAMPPDPISFTSVKGS